MWKNFGERGRPQMAIWRMRIACWIPEATNTHSQYVILIAYPLQQWLHDRASMLRYSTLPVLFYSVYVYIRRFSIFPFVLSINSERSVYATLTFTNYEGKICRFPKHSIQKPALLHGIIRKGRHMSCHICVYIYIYIYISLPYF